MSVGAYLASVSKEAGAPVTVSVSSAMRQAKVLKEVRGLCCRSCYRWGRGACNGACHHYENINRILTKC